jgi:hypothetical protein
MSNHLEELAQLLAAAETALTRRVHLWREIVDEKGAVIGSIYRGSFAAPEPEQPEEETRTS